LEFFNVGKINLRELKIPNEEKLSELFKEYLVYGGMLEVVLQKKYSKEKKNLKIY